MKNLHFYTERLDTLQVILIGLMFCACILVIWVLCSLAFIGIRKLVNQFTAPKVPVNRFKSDLADEADFKDAKQSITLVSVVLILIIIFSMRTNGQGKLQSAARTGVAVQHQ